MATEKRDGRDRGRRRRGLRIELSGDDLRSLAVACRMTKAVGIPVSWDLAGDRARRPGDILSDRPLIGVVDKLLRETQG